MNTSDNETAGRRPFFRRRSVQAFLAVMAIYLLAGLLFFFAAGDSLRFTSGSTETVSPKAALNEFLAEERIEQSFECAYDTLDCVSFLVGTMARSNEDVIRAELLDSDGAVLRTAELETAGMRDNGDSTVFFDPPVENAGGACFTLRLTSLRGTPGNAISFYYGNSVDTGRASVPVGVNDTSALYRNGARMTDGDGNLVCLCLTVRGSDNHWFGLYYWWILGGGALLLACVLLWLIARRKKGKNSAVLMVCYSLYKYKFLIKQLVSRDFKTKYKRSALGMLWSFLNPLLTMAIQYVVFSTLFKTSIPNFVVYLLIGIICFNFFNEATGMCLMSIVGNASLINKVYVPKYIYPFSRTLSSGINLLLSLIPLFLALLITRTPISPAWLLLPFVLLMLFLFSYGIGLILATLMVFFRDTQFLWGIFSMLLMYLTPIFYPETIIPARFLTVYKLNPLYHILRMARSILIDGVSLEPKAYLYCIILCLIPFFLGNLIFRKNQDKFILNV